MEKESVINMWENYRRGNPQAPIEYQAWAFGDSIEAADELARLVVTGIKTATASLYMLYELEDEPLPYAGLHNVILDGEGEPVAIIETTAVDIVPFDQVSAEHAYLEGEGDRSLAYWREVHESFFTRELQGMDKGFDSSMLVVCERFKLVDKRRGGNGRY